MTDDPTDYALRPADDYWAGMAPPDPCPKATPEDILRCRSFFVVQNTMEYQICHQFGVPFRNLPHAQ